MNNINEKLNELIEMLKNQDEVVQYNQIEESLNKNTYILEKLSEFKKMQQKYVLYEHKTGELPEDIQKKYDEAYDALFDIPVFNEYINLQTDINELIQEITNIIEYEINLGLNRIESD